MVKYDGKTADTLSLFSYLNSQYMIKSLLFRKQVKVEQLDNSAILTWGPSLMIGGEFSDAICELLKTKLQNAKHPCYIYAPAGEWDAYIQETFRGNLTEMQINLYEYNGQCLETHPAGTQNIIPITNEWFQQNADNSQLIKNEIYSYLSVEDFLQNGYGLALVIDGNICGYCLSEYSIDNECAITIWIDEKYRGIGYAKVMTKLFLQYSSGKDWKVYWGCDFDNVPSNKTVKSAGFVLHSTQKYYKWQNQEEPT
ncbi:MAG: GNAT family N-acetyltransferase [Firmicutes bacterium]|nr:GNAT family N-acetyltransferase [Bacillota bacterium]